MWWQDIGKPLFDEEDAVSSTMTAHTAYPTSPQPTLCATVTIDRFAVAPQPSRLIL
jgi:hypothetical protein